MTSSNIRDRVRTAFDAQPVVDMHTHLFAPAFNRIAGSGRYLLWGIDELLNYHYLTAELLRARPDLAPETYAAMPAPDRADLVWQTLFVDRPPVSESCRGVLTTLAALGLDPAERTLMPYRGWFGEQDIGAHVDRVMDLAGVSRLTMTNDMFDADECALWLEHADELRADARFDAVVRIDPLFVDLATARGHIHRLGYDAQSIDGIRRFLTDWIDRTDAVYVAASLPPTWLYPGDPEATRVIDEALLPALADAGVPLALMIGVTRGLNPRLGSAGDGVGVADVESLCRLAARGGETHLLVTMLSDQNQHELCVAARKFANITPFGCWWFLNTPHSIERITRLRLELLGSTFIPQHSDARVLEQIIYKWKHSREIIACALGDHLAGIEAAGRSLGDADIAGEIDRLVRTNYEAVIGLRETAR